MEPIRRAVHMVRSSSDGNALALNSRQLLNCISNKAESFQAFLHPLGFIHAELTELLDEQFAGMRVRVHIWTSPCPESDALGLVHDHMWELKSCVLVGELTDLTIEAVAEDRGSHDAIRVKYGSKNEFTHEGRVNLREVQRRNVGPGQVYHIPSRRIHETVIDVAPVVTLLVSKDDPPGSPGPLIFTPHPAELAGTAERSLVSGREIAAICRDLANAAG
ncbi:hypothetical protein [Streptomyces sp. GESEQ-4]|uniref:hypothetical protein n=1 Tax=Streptomyces sp. GESEQ-4 TaxID=2812655 RepID=UPI001B31AEC9|nr:hypothetical protein [Streptomyces sp. GESEQ-4]